jgi:hypothetical protein
VSIREQLRRQRNIPNKKSLALPSRMRHRLNSGCRPPRSCNRIVGAVTLLARRTRKVEWRNRAGCLMTPEGAHEADANRDLWTQVSAD